MLRKIMLASLLLCACGLYAQGYTVTGGSIFSFTPLTAPTVLTLGDNELSAVQSPPGFAFTYFGAAYTQFSVGSNGYIIMGAQGATTAMQPSHATAPGLVISPFWGDMRPNLQGQIGWSFSGGKLTVEWLGVRLATSTAQGGPYNVQIQIVLDTATGEIEFDYGDYGGFGIGPGSPWDYTCAISGPSGAAQAIVPGNLGSFISATGKITLWPLLDYVKFTPIIVPNNPPTLSVTRNGTPVADAASLVVAADAILAAQNLVITATDTDGDSVSVNATITNLGATGILESEFSNAGAPAPYSLAPASGVFNVPSTTHHVSLLAQDGKGGQAQIAFNIVVSARGGTPGFGAATGSGGGACTAADEGTELPTIVIFLLSILYWFKRRKLQTALVLLAALVLAAGLSARAVWRRRRAV